MAAVRTIRGTCMYTHQAALALLLAATTAVSQAQTPVRASLVKDFNTAPAQIGSDPRDFVALNGKVYFSAWRPGSGRELFAVDTPAGQPYSVAELAPGGASSNPRVLGVVGGRLIVSARVGNTASDEMMGPPATYSVNPVNGAATLISNLTPDGLGTFAGKVLLHTGYDNALLATDGTVAGTSPLMHGAPDDFNGVPSSANRVCLLPDRAMFMARREGSWQLWLSNGQTLGTGVVLGLPELYPVAARAYGDGCYFLTAADSGGWQLWLSNGTAGGTGVVAGSADGSPFDLAIVGGAALVLDTLGVDRLRVWRAGSTTPLLDHTGGYPGKFTSNGQQALFSLGLPGVHPVFISDGTPAGTRRVEVADGVPLMLNPIGSDPVFASVGGLMLTADAQGLWRIDAATARAESVSADAIPTFRDSAVLGNSVLAAAFRTGNGEEPWRTDGTSAGTQQLADLATATARGIDDGEAAVYGNVLVLSHIGPTDPQDVHHGQLWRTDGRSEGTWALPGSAYGGSDVHQVQALGDGVLFSADTVPRSNLRQLYRTDTDFAATTALPATTFAGDTFLQGVGNGNTAALFHCGDPLAQRNICRVGADDNQIITLQYAHSGWPQRIASLGKLALYFVPGQGLFRSDGTVPGTWLLRSGLSPYDANPYRALRAQALGSRLLFQACEGQVCGLWASDGTPGGTLRLISMPRYIHDFSVLGNRAFFLVTEPFGMLWETDGTPANTRVTAQLIPRPSRLATVGAYLHMSGDSVEQGYVVSDGTQQGTVAIPTPPSFPFPAFGPPQALDANTAVFSCNQYPYGGELCAIDADGSHLRRAVDIYPGPNSSWPLFVARTSDALYFAADDGVHGRELWRVTALVDAIFADGFSH